MVALATLLALQPGMAQTVPVNLSHLNSLCEPVTIGGTDMALLHIYASAPDYHWADASGEGIACVDDAARAAVVYLKYFQRYQDPDALERARRLLRFVMYLQAADGQYYNFVLDRAGTINTGGDTSRKEAGWWAARGQWALAAGYATFKDRDPALARDLDQHYLLGQHAFAKEMHLPRLIHDAGDLTGLVVVGLCEYQAYSPNPETRSMIEGLSDALSRYRFGDARTAPFGIHPDTTGSQSRWHAWGSHQVQALAAASALLHRSDWLASARGEADDLYAPMLASDMVSRIETIPECRSQIAYGDSVVVSGLMNIYRAGGDAHYARLAGLAASWLLQDNRAGRPLYDAASGRGYDGVDGLPARVNMNSGAESTIESLWTLLQLQDCPVALRYLSARGHPQTEWRTVEAEAMAAGRTVVRGGTAQADYSGGAAVLLHRGETLTIRIPIESPGPYDVFLTATHGPALVARLDGRPLSIRAGAPQRQWLWMNRLTEHPIHLSQGYHTLLLRASQDAIVDAASVRPQRFSRIIWVDGHPERISNASR